VHSYLYSRKPHTRPTQAHYMHNTVHGCHSGLTHYQLWSTNNQSTSKQHNYNYCPALYPNDQQPLFSNQEHQTPASQETQQFPATSLPTPSQQQPAENIAAQSTPPRRRCSLQSQAIRNVSTNYLVHFQANADVTPLNMSQPQIADQPSVLRATGSAPPLSPNANDKTMAPGLHATATLRLRYGLPNSSRWQVTVSAQ